MHNEVSVTVTNAKHLGDNKELDLQQLAKQMMPCLRRYEDGRLNGDFTYYVIPELFLCQNVLKQRDWFRLADDRVLHD